MPEDQEVDAELGHELADYVDRFADDQMVGDLNPLDGEQRMRLLQVRFHVLAREQVRGRIVHDASEMDLDRCVGGEPHGFAERGTGFGRTVVGDENLLVHDCLHEARVTGSYTRACFRIDRAGITAAANAIVTTKKQSRKARVAPPASSWKPSPHSSRTASRLTPTAPPSCRAKFTAAEACPRYSAGNVCTAPTLSAGMINPRPARPIVSHSASSQNVVVPVAKASRRLETAKHARPPPTTNR